MTRVRISTTVDGERLAAARRMLGATVSEVIDRALDLLVADLERERELAALREQPYEDASELSWSASPGPDVPYEGDIPEDVLQLALQRRPR